MQPPRHFPPSSPRNCLSVSLVGRWQGNSACLSFYCNAAHATVLLLCFVGTVHDPSEAISNKLGEKIAKTRLPGFVKIRMHKRLSAAAGKIVQPTMVATKMAAKMQEEMPKKMLTKGITADLKEEFREGA